MQAGLELSALPNYMWDCPTCESQWSFPAEEQIILSISKRKDELFSCCYRWYVKQFGWHEVARYKVEQEDNYPGAYEYD